MKPTRATWFLTHRCNIACSYCATILPEQVTPDADEQRTSAIAASIAATLPEVVIVTGGEPAMHPHAQRVVDIFRRLGQEFVWLTNGTRPFKLYGVRNVSASVDIGDGPWRRADATRDELYKSAHGLAFLVECQRVGMSATASVVIGRDNAMRVARLVETMWLTDSIPSMVSVLHEGKTLDPARWRFRSRHANAALTTAQAIHVSGELLALRDRHPEAILNDVGYLAGIEQHGAALDWHCQTPSDLVVDSDGSILTCSDWWGAECKALNVVDALTDPEGWLRRWDVAHRADNARCRGCFWNCAYQAESAASSLYPGRTRA